MKKRPEWQKLKRFIKGNKHLLITTHVIPDGDAIGSEIAMAEYAKQCGCQVTILNNDPTPEFFRFVDEHHEIQVFAAERHESLIRSVDGCVVVDISDWPRLKEIGRWLRHYQIPVACVDHHIPTDHMGLVQVNLEYASSAGEVLYRFFKSVRAPLNRTMINALYMCVFTDTGGFRYSNTSPFVLRMAADLHYKGAEVDRIYEQVYENESHARTLLKGRVLTDLKYECEGRLAYFGLSQALLRETGAELWETEGFSELPRVVKGVEISMMFTETVDRRVRVSFRSKGRVAINGLAMKFGGGGHRYAAGATVSMSLTEAIEQILAEAKTLFTQDPI